MTNRDRKKSMLKSYPFIELQIQSLIDQYNELFTMATHITATYEGAGSANHSDESKVEKRCIKLSEAALKISKARKKKAKIDMALAELKPYYRFLITEIDIKDKGVYRVAKETKRDPSTLSKTHNKALDALKI